MAQFFHCNKNIRCIQLIIPIFMLVIVCLMKLYTCQFNSNKVRQYRNLFFWSKDIIILLFIIPYNRDLLRLSDCPIKFIKSIFRSKVLLINCVTIGRSWIARRNMKLWKSMPRTQNWLLLAISVRINNSLYYSYFNKLRTIIPFRCSISFIVFIYVYINFSHAYITEHRITSERISAYNYTL